jgi:hypothetical protein
MTRASDIARLIGAGATINDGTTITTADNTTQLTLKSTDADGSSGPLLDLTRDSGSPADGDVTGIIRFRADNDAGEVTTTGQIVSLLNDASDGTEDGEMKLEVMSGGAAQSRIDIIPSETVFNEGSIDVDFRVESNGNANMLVVDAGNDRVGIGTNSPSAPLTISTTGSGDAVIIESTESGSSNAPDLVLHRNSASPADNDSLGIIRFRGENDASEAIDLINIFGQVTDVSDGSEDSTLFFKTYTNGAEQSPLTLVGANVGIGESSPANLLHVKASDVSAAPIDTALIVLEKSGTNFLSFMGANTDVQGVLFGDADDNDVGQLVYNHSSNTMDFKTNGSERMRIDSSGHVSIGTTSTGGNSALTLLASSFSGGIKIFGANGQVIQSFEVGGNAVGRIEVNNTATIYSTSSDYRLKENVITDWDATTRLKQLKPSRFNFKTDKATTVDGFLAHEVSSIVPEAISGEKDAVDADGNIEPQGIDQSKLVPLMVKTIQELEARIATLESK